MRHSSREKILTQRFENGRRSPGFTILELLVVIAVIFILAKLLFPALSRAKEVSRRAACASNLHQIVLGINVYKDDFGGAVPQTLGGAGWLWDLPVDTTNLFEQRLNLKRAMFYCPSNQYQNNDALWNLSPSTRVTGYYWLMERIGGAPALTNVVNNIPHYVSGFPDPTPSETPLVTDATISTGSTTTSSFSNIVGGWSQPHRSNHFSAAMPVYGNVVSLAQPAAGGNVAFCDGHVEWKNLSRMAVHANSPYQWF